MHPVEQYLRNLKEIRTTGGGTAETSYYGALETLLNEVGRKLNPRIRCVMQLQNRGAGFPDGGLFTKTQCQDVPVEQIMQGQKPARGAIEVKSTADETWLIADTKQVTAYWEKYGLVLVTNYRDFLLVEKDAQGQSVKGESFRLANNEKSFWELTRHPAKAAKEVGERLLDYLTRVCLHGAQLVEPRDLAWFLASYGRDALDRVIHRKEIPALLALRGALEEALGMTFTEDRGEHFFRSTLVQMIFYGIFSAWVLWHRDGPAHEDLFDWRTAQWLLRVPIIRRVYTELNDPAKLGQLGLIEVLDRTAGVLNRVDRPAFFERFQEEEAVQYFYEPFLEAFDPILRKQLGVWYTPNEIVKYQVARIDKALRDDLHIEKGLADPSVIILDPCCGTGAYLVEVLRSIASTLRESGDDALVSSDLKRAAVERVFGFEILAAPFVISHLQLGLELQREGVPLTADERLGVFLTNSLTGWGVSEHAKHLVFPELEEERDAAETVKQEERVLVVVGNPPYDGYAGVAISEERELTDAYRETKVAPKPVGQGLNDPLVRFYRMAERRIVEMNSPSRGIVCLITNYGWLEKSSYPGMRERFLEVFDEIRIDSLNGDKYKTGKLTPDGKPDPSVFSTSRNPSGIQVGTAIALLIRKSHSGGTDQVMFRDFWGAKKREALLKSANDSTEKYLVLNPKAELGFPFRPAQVASQYLEWPLVSELLPVSFPGVKTSRDQALVSFDRDTLKQLMLQYYDTSVSDETIQQIAPSLMASTRRFDAAGTRSDLRQRGMLEKNIVRYFYRPFDLRWVYWEPETKLLDEKRPDYFPQIFEGNWFLFTNERIRKEDAEPALVSSFLTDLNAMDSGARGFPMYTRDSGIGALLPEESANPRPNASDQASQYCASLNRDGEALFFHIAAILNSPLYLTENRDGMRYNWPRIALPEDAAALDRSAALGRQVALLMDQQSSACFLGNLQRSLAAISKVGGGQLSESDSDLLVSASWGWKGPGEAAMPGKGRVIERDYTEEEMAGIKAEAVARGLGVNALVQLLGSSTLDIYINDVAYWRNIPLEVWEYSVGGYQVIKKYLSYRDVKVLGRSLRTEEVRQVTDIVRRLTAIILLHPELDANYERIKAHTWQWPK